MAPMDRQRVGSGCGCTSFITWMIAFRNEARQTPPSAENSQIWVGNRKFGQADTIAARQKIDAHLIARFISCIEGSEKIAQPHHLYARITIGLCIKIGFAAQAVDCNSITFQRVPFSAKSSADQIGEQLRQFGRFPEYLACQQIFHFTL